MKNEEFDDWWTANKTWVLMEDREYREAVETYKMKSGADWLLFGIPLVAGIVSLNYLPIAHEILKFLAAVAITIVVSVVCVYIKSLTNPHRAIADIENDVRQRTFEEYNKTGKFKQKRK